MWLVKKESFSFSDSLFEPEDIKNFENE